MSGTLMNRSAPALVASIAAARRLDRFGSDAAPFRSTLVLSALLGSNPTAQLVTSLRSADDIAEVLADRGRLRSELATHRLAILDAPGIAGTPAEGSELKAVPGRYAGTGNTTVQRRDWVLAQGGWLHTGDSFTPGKREAGQEITLWEILDGPAGPVAVASATVRVAPGQAAAGAPPISGGPGTAPPTIPAAAPPPARPPSITGTPKVSTTLGIDAGDAATVAADASQPRTVEWMHEGSTTPLHTGDDYTPRSQDEKKRLVAVLKVPLRGGGTATFQTAPFGPVEK